MIKEVLKFNRDYYKVFNIGEFGHVRINKIIDMLPENKTVLDLACFDGTITELIKAKNNEVIGLEMSPNALKTATKKDLNLIQGDVTILPFTSNSFDIVVAGEIIEHLYDTGGFLEEIKRVLKPEGNLIITTPNLASLANRARILFGFQPPTCNIELDGQVGHIRAFTKSALVYLLEKHGFIIEKERSDLIMLPAFNKVLESISTRLGDIFPGIGTILIFKAHIGRV